MFDSILDVWTSVITLGGAMAFYVKMIRSLDRESIFLYGEGGWMEGVLTQRLLDR